MTNESKPILVLVGPTASGKTALSVQLASGLPTGGECISADSMQVYQGMDIGTATPTEEERAGIPHHLLDVADPHDTGFTVHDWLKAAETAIAEIHRRGSLPIVVGGTNLYLRGLLEGVFEGQSIPAEIRSALEALPTEALRQRLVKLDPVSAQRIHANDRRRTIRALEVMEATGSPISSQQTQWADAIMQPRRPALIVCLDWHPSELNQRINRRVGLMMEQGFLEEVQRLRASGPLGRQATEAVGYKELAGYLDGSCKLSEAIEQIKIRSRRYGKQQRTWIRRFHAIPGVFRVACSEKNDPAEVVQQIVARLEEPSNSPGRPII
ncbi:MAG: tRNA (adenosine(37)-N6)-dimethylallyltransferase MiaA [Planctomycetes bacterium TMED75]|nr:tRNA (adenosine(37)-N6)-dimethylallyltransferase MiaA [Planctomycetaceae bacterium]OUU96076.1 MAG: tRNA (adenosine(37)-N6)-dimethylallyltransferase MiaA [Planctomycetes bacterium TMED75]